MLFNSWVYWLFLPITIAVYYALRGRSRIAWLLICSYVFYAWWDWRFLGLIVVSSIIDFICGRLLDRRRDDDPDEYALDRKKRRTVLVVSLVANLGMLAFFKYAGFFAESFAEVLGALGLGADFPTLKIVLPVGISFFTFQTMSYSIDIYRGRLRAENRFLEFATFVAFFPQLVAGPIVRASDFLPQLASPTKFNSEQFYSGTYLILWGLFKKVVVADNVGTIANQVFNAPVATMSSGQILLGVYAFAIQIYGDFSGYTDIARGTARLLGFEFPLNFDLPYSSADPSEFWRRWHISLSSWLRDYLYIPLGGNRGSSARTQFNLMTTMVLGGLWHGAAWNFVVWGFYQGGLLVVHRWFRNTFGPAPENPSRLRRLIVWFVFMQFVCFGWLIFRAESMSQIVEMSAGLMNVGNIMPAVRDLARVAMLVSPLIVVDLMQYRVDDELWVFRHRAPVRGLLYAMLILGILIFGNFSANEFIYFQF